VSEKNNSNSKVSQLEKELLTEKNANREILRIDWRKNELKKWRMKSWVEFIILSLIFVFGICYISYLSNWELNKTVESIKTLKSNILISTLISFLIFIFNSITIKTLIEKYRNHSNINNYISGLTIPIEMRELK
jgi:hypothetical protein